MLVTSISCTLTTRLREILQGLTQKFVFVRAELLKQAQSSRVNVPLIDERQPVSLSEPRGKAAVKTRAIKPLHSKHVIIKR